MFNGGPLSWCSHKQTVTATLSTESEVVALCAAAKPVIGMRRLLNEIGINQNKDTPIKCDSHRAITLVKALGSSTRTKHIDIQNLYTCDQQRNNETDFEYISTTKRPIH